MTELTDTDIKILRYIKKHDSASLTEMETAMPDVAALRYRIEQLSTPEYRGAPGISIPIQNTAYIEQDYEIVASESGRRVHQSLGTYRLTAFGDKALQDYEHNCTTHKRELWLKNAWIPILVTLVTNLLIYGIKLLWPLIQGWLSHTP